MLVNQLPGFGQQSIERIALVPPVLEGLIHSPSRTICARKKKYFIDWYLDFILPSLSTFVENILTNLQVSLPVANFVLGTWFKNTTCYIDRFKGFPDRIDNLYFLWSVMVRSISKLSPYLQNYPFCLGNGDEEIITVLFISNERNMLIKLSLLRLRVLLPLMKLSCLITEMLSTWNNK